MARTGRRELWISALLLWMVSAWLVSQWPKRGLWYDETVNAYFAIQSWGDLWEWCTRIDNQMPLHFALLKAWGGVGGISEFALRLPSYWSALLTVAALIALGRRLSTYRAGWLAAVAFAVTQSFLYAAFEVRPYGLALALAAWASVVLWEVWHRYAAAARPLDRYGRGMILAYWLLAWGLWYTHYTGVLVLAVHLALVGWQTLRRPTQHRRAMAMLLGGGALVGLLPWYLALAGRDVRAGTAYAGRVDPPAALRSYAQFYAHGQRAIPADAPPYEWAMGMVLGLGCLIWLGTRRQHRQPLQSLLMPLVAVLLPLTGLVALVYGVQAKLSGRHGWMTWLGAALLFGIGYGALRPGLRLRWLVWLGALMVLWLPAQADYPPAYNSYLREAFAYVREHAAPDDVLILRDGTLFTAAGYYGTTVPWIGLPPEPLTDVHRFLFFDEALEALERLVTEHNASRVWVLSWQGDIMDPQNLVAGMLEFLGEEEPLPGAFGFGDVSLARYRLERLPQAWRAQGQSLVPLVQFPADGPWYLGGYVLGDQTVSSGATLRLHTWWQRGPAVHPGARLSLRLYDRNGTLVAQHDQPPVGPSFGQENWAPDTPILGRLTLAVPPDMLAGPAEVRLILYDMDGAFDPLEVRLARLDIAQ